MRLRFDGLLLLPVRPPQSLLLPSPLPTPLLLRSAAAFAAGSYAAAAATRGCCIAPCRAALTLPVRRSAPMQEGEPELDPELLALARPPEELAAEAGEEEGPKDKEQLVARGEPRSWEDLSDTEQDGEAWLCVCFVALCRASCACSWGDVVGHGAGR